MELLLGGSNVAPSALITGSYRCRKVADEGWRVIRTGVHLFLKEYLFLSVSAPHFGAQRDGFCCRCLCPLTCKSCSSLWWTRQQFSMGKQFSLPCSFIPFTAAETWQKWKNKRTTNKIKFLEKKKNLSRSFISRRAAVGLWVGGREVEWMKSSGEPHFRSPPHLNRRPWQRPLIRRRFLFARLTKNAKTNASLPLKNTKAINSFIQPRALF